MAALAAEAAEDAPRASMIAAPRLATVGMKSSASHFSSLTTSAAFLPATSAWKMSGYWVAEWLPQIVSLLMSETGGAGLLRELRERAVVVEAGHRGEALGRYVRGGGLGDQRVGVGRVADDEDLDVVRGVVVDGLALRLEDAAVGLEQVAALHALGTGAGADEQRDVGAVEGDVRVVGDVDALQQREGAVVELHGGALGGLQRLGDLQQAQLDRHVRAEQLAGGDAEEQRVADLAGRAGDGDIDGSAGHGDLRRTAGGGGFVGRASLRDAGGRSAPCPVKKYLYIKRSAARLSDVSYASAAARAGRGGAGDRRTLASPWGVAALAPSRYGAGHACAFISSGESL